MGERRIGLPLFGSWRWRTFRGITLAAPIGFILMIWIYISWIGWPSNPALRAAFITAVSVAASLGFATFLLTAIDRAYRRLEGAVHTAERQNLQLRALHEAGLGLAQDLDVHIVLTKVVNLSREVLGARSAALRVLSPDGHPEELLTSGEGAPDGMLNGTSGAGQHPVLNGTLAVPIRFRDQTLGFLYLSDKSDREPFTAEDGETVERFAAQAGSAIANARLMRRVRRLGGVAERERIGRELHDGTLQGLYGLSLHLQAALLDGQNDTSAAAVAIGQALSRINEIMGEIRRYVLTAEESNERVVLETAVRAAVRGVVPVTGPTLHWNWKAPADLEALARVAHDLAYAVREGVSNAVRHAQAQTIGVIVDVTGDFLRFSVIDDGVGFTPGQGRPGHGLAHIARRVEALSGTLVVNSVPGRGTHLEVTVPVSRLTQMGVNER